MGLAIRAVTLADAEPLACLMSDLGYATSSGQMEQRLTLILGDGSYRTFVACDGTTIAGVIGTRIGPMYELDHRYGQIMALVVGAAYRRHGVGQMLVQAAESHFIEQSGGVSIVTSAHRRADAHAFYEKHGYTFDGRRYKKHFATVETS